ncbi:hypothetical protein [Myroides sp. WP-1]|uniref:hypothetical protein n=1 Tax=Myroides sp. WP-1 TaxID=2759944 RepID=UPI0015FB4921|nr:hypothetical protein [Myroides sp. WP-1]MBB1139268.1 hypothetical protein [Myroides sp. WP-1]
MNRLFYYFGIILVGVGTMGCQDKSTSSTPTEVETSTPVDQVKLDSAIEEYELIKQDTLDELNEAIKREKLTSVENIMRFYAPEDTHAEGKYSYDITVLKMSDTSVTLVTLVEDGINDDSMKAKKVVMTVNLKEGQYHVTKIKQSYQCWEGRGHANWNSNHCS